MAAPLMRGCQSGCSSSSRCAAVVTFRQLSVSRLARCKASLDEEVAVPEVGWLWDAKAKETRDKLKAISARPKKALGQNFVTDDAVLERIVRQSGVTEGDLVLEIGPGTGNLTKCILQAGATVLAIEKDYVLADKLGQVFAEQTAFKVQQGDALRLNLRELVDELKAHHAAVRGLPSEELDGMRVKVVANLPYYITTDILKDLFPLGDIISDVAFMLQDEVAQRLTAPHPDGSAYRPMTVFAHYFSEPSYKFRIDRSCYYPSPNVHGALAVFTLRSSSERRLLAREREFMIFVRQAFSSKRKMLTNSLQPKWKREVVAQAVTALGFDVAARPQDISSELFVDLFQEVCAVEQSQNAAPV